MAKSYDGRPTTSNLKLWTNYGQLGTEAKEPTRDNQNPDGVRHLDGSNNPASWSKGDRSQHKFFKGSGGSDSGVGRAELARAQGRKRRA